MLAAFFAFLLLFLFQDSVLVEPEPAPVTNWYGYLVGYVASNLVPLATSWLTQKFINVRDTWFPRQNDMVKRLVYIGVTSLAMLAVQTLGVGWEDTADAPTVISKI